MDIARAHIYSSSPQSAVDERYARWGGIARYVLEPLAADEEASILAEAINNVDWDEIKKALKSMEGGGKFSHRLLHYIVDLDTLQVRLQTTH